VPIGNLERWVREIASGGRESQRNWLKIDGRLSSSVKEHSVAGDGVTDDTVNIQAAIVSCERTGRSLYFPAPTTLGDFYKITAPLLVRGPIHIFGDGKPSLIKNTATGTDGSAFRGACFYLGNLHPSTIEDITSFDCDAITQGDLDVVSSTATGIVADDYIYIRSTEYILSNSSEAPLFLQMNQVLSISGTTYTLRYPIDETLANPKILPAQTSAVQDASGNNIFICHDAKIENISVECVWPNSDIFSPIMATIDCDIHFSHSQGARKGGTGWLGNSNYNSKLTIDHAVTLKRVHEFALGSASCHVKLGRVDYVGLADHQSVLIRFGESARDNILEIGVLNAGSYVSGALISMGGGARRNKLIIGSIFAPAAHAGIEYQSNTRNSPETQDLVEDNEVTIDYCELGHSTVAFFINYLNTGGTNKRNHIGKGRFFAPNDAAVTDHIGLLGSGHIIHEDLVLEDSGQVYYSGSAASFNPGDIADGDHETKTITVPGAELGDYVTRLSFSLDLGGLHLNGYVSAANTVTAILSNNSGSAINLGEGTLRAAIRKQS